MKEYIFCHYEHNLTYGKILKQNKVTNTIDVTKRRAQQMAKTDF